MPESDEIFFECIGCRTMNPAGSSVCAGCGYRFKEDDLGPPQPSKRPPSLPNAVRPIEPEPFRISDDGEYSTTDIPESSVGRTFAKVVGSLLLVFLGTVVVVIALAFAFIIAFSVTCGVGPGGHVQLVGIGFCMIGAGATLIAAMNLIFRFLKR